MAPKSKPVVKTGRVLEQVQAPTTEQPKAEKPKAAKRPAEWRKVKLPADTAVITFNHAAYTAKPKRNKSKVRIEEAYKPGMTVAQFREFYVEQAKAERVEYKGGKTLANADLRWDSDHGYISFSE